MNASMTDSAFCNSDGDFLFVAQQGALDLVTEFGRLHVAPLEIAVVPVSRGSAVLCRAANHRSLFGSAVCGSP